MLRDSGREATLTIPHDIAVVADRMCKDQHWTFEKSLLVLLNRGVAAQAAADQDLEMKYEAFMKQTDPVAQNKAGEDLIRSVFGPGSIA